MDKLADLEKSVVQEQAAAAAHQQATVVVEKKRSKIWELLGERPYGNVSFAGLSFSKPVVAIGGVFAGLFAGIILFTPTVAIVLAAVAAIGGLGWLRGWFRG